MRELNSDRKTGGIVSMARRASIIALLLGILGGMTSVVAHAQAPPVVFFTDLSSGPNSGGDSQGGFSGVYVTLYGNYFGSSQGSSTVTWNGLNCLRVVPPTGAYTGWGMSYMWYQKIIVQLGTGCTAGAGNFVVTVNGVASISPSVVVNGAAYNGSLFTVRSGNIYCVASTGADSGAGTFAAGCWKTLVYSKNRTSPALTSGDIIYAKTGTDQTSSEAFLASFSVTAGPFSPSVAFVTYPGSTVTIGTNGNSGSVQYGIRNPSIGGTPSGYVFAGFSIRGPSCTQMQADNYRWIANDMSCSGATGYGGFNTNSINNHFLYGNRIHDTGQSCPSNSGSCKLYHAMYFGDHANHIDFGWNIVDPDPAHTGIGGCRGVQWHVTVDGANEFDLHIHDNIIRNSICDGLNLVTVNPDLGPVEVFNNVLYHNGTGPDPSGQGSGYACIATAAQNATPSTPVQIYNNSLYDCGPRANGFSSGAFEAQMATSFFNNVVQSASSNEPYFTGISSACSSFSGSNNDWFGAGASPCASNLTASLNLDPLFASTGLATFSAAPQISSPLLAAGRSASPVAAYDITGTRRPSPPAIGAYETAGVSVPRPNPPSNLVITVQ
jgi:trimeric autotransporter adhesin